MRFKINPPINANVIATRRLKSGWAAEALLTGRDTLVADFSAPTGPPE
jgi:hypothetical protein